jgi:hypothetical protein
MTAAGFSDSPVAPKYVIGSVPIQKCAATTRTKRSPICTNSNAPHAPRDKSLAR